MGETLMLIQSVMNSSELMFTELSMVPTLSQLIRRYVKAHKQKQLSWLHKLVEHVELTMMLLICNQLIKAKIFIPVLELAAWQKPQRNIWKLLQKCGNMRFKILIWPAVLTITVMKWLTAMEE